MKLQQLFAFLYIISSVYTSFIISNQQSSINKIESPKNESKLASSKMLAHLSKLGHSLDKSTDYDFSNFDFEKLMSPKKINEKPKIPPVFKSAQIDQNVRGLDQLKSMYESLKSGDLINDDKNINTVRFIPSSRIQLKNKKISYAFNLSLLTESEKILKSEIYFNRKILRLKPIVNLHYFISKTSELNDLVGRMINSTVSSIIDLSKFRLGRKNSNWHTFNLGDSLSSFLATRYNRLKFSQSNFNKPNFYYTFDSEVIHQNELEDLILIIESSRFRKIDLNSEPYLIVYSNEKESEMKNFFKNRLTTEIVDEKLKLDNNELDFVEESTEVYHSKDSSVKLIEKKPLLNDKSRNKSNLFNYIPDFKEKFNTNDNVELIFKDHVRSKLKRDLDEDGDEELNEEGDVLMPSDDTTWNHDSNETKVEQIKCHSKALTVDFEDLSFSSWIIEPKRFQSNFCSGSCKYPYNKESSYSNYAALQSILNIVDLSVNNHPTELCCAPSVTKMMPIFYKDLNSVDYVVKYLPDMIVKECACR
ncbi:unnamed protein product [Brachionus calyciflorus]|uniref:TGF-beta family profile domain-containing protein n=1 Tax=Brachionus calyciflorus TaxID=104777 RepID=A0A813MES5_9BILA|nr:unnamed protein product [Brachionus calyciflorus]